MAVFDTSASDVPDPTRRALFVRVREHESRSALPIARALVTISSDSSWRAQQPIVSAQTDSDGVAALPIERPGKYFVRIAAAGYEGTLISAALRPAAGDTLFVQLPYVGCLIR
jgi:hypothetical protein